MYWSNINLTNILSIGVNNSKKQNGYFVLRICKIPGRTAQF